MTSAENTTPTPTRAQAEAAVSAMLSVANARENLATRLEVALYDAWYSRFEETRDVRAAAGIANAKIFRGSDSENTLVVLADMPDLQNAAAWAEGGWRTALPADGVQGPPAVYFGTDPDRQADGVEEPVEEPSLKGMAHFRVEDYERWHELFLVMQESRVAGGLINPSIFRGSEDGNDVLALADVTDAATFRAWLVEDYMTGYPAETGAGTGTFRFAVRL
jgi:hypothetical protein